MTRTNGATSVNGWVEEQYDPWRLIIDSPGVDVEQRDRQNREGGLSYSATTGLKSKVRTSYYDGAATTYPIADTVYEYAADGELLREGLDVNTNGTLDLGGTDRVNAYDTVFVQDSWGRYQEATVDTYATANSSTATEVSKTRTRFTGFNNGQMSGGSFAVADVTTFDASGWRTVQWTWIDPIARKRLNTTQLNGVSTIAEEWMVRGYPEDAKNTNVWARQEDHAYGRLVTQKSRGHGTVPNITYDATTSYAYFGPTSVASSDTTGGITTGYAYAWDATAHTTKVTVTDAAGKTIHTLTNAMGLCGGPGVMPRSRSSMAMMPSGAAIR